MAKKMTVKEWREQTTYSSYTMVWAADAGSFGRKGGSVYGSNEVSDRFEIVSIDVQKLSFPEPHDFPVLHVIDPVVIHRDWCGNND